MHEVALLLPGMVTTLPSESKFLQKYLEENGRCLYEGKVHRQKDLSKMGLYFYKDRVYKIYNLNTRKFISLQDTWHTRRQRETLWYVWIDYDEKGNVYETKWSPQELPHHTSPMCDA